MQKQTSGPRNTLRSLPPPNGKYELTTLSTREEIGDRRHIRDKTRAVDPGPENGVERVIQPKAHDRYLRFILD